MIFWHFLMYELLIVGFLSMYDGWLFFVFFWHINLCRLFNAKFIFMQIVLFQTIQFSISTHFSSFWHIDRILSGATTMGHSGPVSNGITGALPSDCLVSYQDTHWRESYPSAGMQSVYSAAPANWVIYFLGEGSQEDLLASWESYSFGYVG